MILFRKNEEQPQKTIIVLWDVYRQALDRIDYEALAGRLNNKKNGSQYTAYMCRQLAEYELCLEALKQFKDVGIINDITKEIPKKLEARISNNGTTREGLLEEAAKYELRFS